jgi:hypothetical protein
MVTASLFIALLAAFLVVFLVLLAFTIIFPIQWARLVDREYEFFLRRGLVSESVSRGFKRLEKGFVLKLALAGTIIVGLMDMTVVVMRYVLGFRI